MDYKTKIIVDMSKAVRDLETLKKSFTGNDKAVNKFTEELKKLTREQKALERQTKRTSATNTTANKKLQAERAKLIASIRNLSTLQRNEIANSKHKVAMNNLEIQSQRKLIAEKARETALREKSNAAKLREIALAQKGLSSLDKEYARLNKIRIAREKLNLAVKHGLVTRSQANNILAKYTRSLNVATLAINKFTMAQAKSTHQSSLFSRALLFQSKLFHLMMLGLSVKMVIDWGVALERSAEKLDLLGKKMKYFSKEADSFNNILAKSMEVGVAIDDLGRIMTRFAITTKQAFSTTEMLGWTDALVRSARATGTTTQEMNNALIQLSQSFSSGFLMGDEYRSISENLPMYKIALEETAKAQGIFTGSIKKMSSARLIDTQLMTDAMDTLALMVAEIPGAIDTIDAAVQRFNVGWSAFVKSMLDAAGNIDVTKNSLNFLGGLLAKMSGSEAAMTGFIKNFPEMNAFIDESILKFKFLTIEIEAYYDILGGEWISMSIDGWKMLLDLIYNGWSLIFDLLKQVDFIGLINNIKTEFSKLWILIESNSIISFKNLAKYFNEFELISLKLAITIRTFFLDVFNYDYLNALRTSFADFFDMLSLGGSINIFSEMAISLRNTRTAYKGMTEEQRNSLKILIDSKKAVEEKIKLYDKEIAKTKSLISVRMDLIKGTYEKESEVIKQSIIENKELAIDEQEAYNRKINMEKQLRVINNSNITAAKKAAREKKKLEDVAKKSSKDLAKIETARLKSLEESMNLWKKFNPILSEYLDDMKEIAIALDKGILSEEAYNEKIKERIDLLEEQQFCESLQQTISCVEELKREYDSVYAATKKLEEEQIKLSKLVSNGTITQQVANRTLQQYSQELLEAKAAAGDLGASFTLMWQEFGDGFVENTKGLLSDVLKGEEDAFENFTDRILDMWVDMIAEMAIQALMADFSFNMSGSGSSGSSASSIGGQTSIGGINLSDASSLNSLGNAFSAGSELLTTAMDWGVGSAIGSIGASTAFMSAGAGATQAAMLASQTAAFGAAGTTATVSALGGVTASGMASAAMTAIPYVGIAVAIASMLGAFDSDSDTSPDLNLSYWSGNGNESLAKEYVNNPNGMIPVSFDEDAAFGVQGRFGSTYISTQHDAFAGEQESKAFADSIKARMDGLDDLIYFSLGSALSEEVISAMQIIESGEIKYEDMASESGDAIENMFNVLYNNVFKSIGDVVSEDYELVYRDFLNTSGELSVAVGAFASYKGILDSGSERSMENITNAMHFFVDSADGVENQLNELSAVTQLLSFENAIDGFEIFMSDFDEVIASGSTDRTAVEFLALANNLLYVNSVLDNTNQNVYDLSLAGSELAESLVIAAGGFDSFATKMDFFYNSFYSEQERTAIVLEDTSKVIADFNEEFETSILSKDSLRDLMESLDLTTESGIELYNNLLNLAPTVSLNAEAIEALEETAVAFNDSMKELYHQLKGESEVSNTIRQIDELMLKFNMVGDHASLSRDDLADFVITLNAFDDETVKAEGDIQSLGQAIIKLDEIVIATQAEIDSLLNDQRLDDINDSISLENERLTIANDIYNLDLERYQAAIDANETIMSYLDSLKISDLNLQSPFEQMQESAKLFSDAVESGDSQEATQYAQEYLQFAKGYYATTEAYGDIFNDVTDSLEGMISDPGIEPTESTSSSISSLESEKLAIESQSRTDELTNQNLELIELFNTLALAKDASIFAVAESNNVDLWTQHTELLGSLSTLNNATIQSMADYAIANGLTSDELATTLGIDYTSMIMSLNGIGYTLLDIKDYDEYISGNSLLTFEAMVQMAKDQVWSTNTLASKMGTTNQYVVDELVSQGYTLDSLDEWNAMAVSQNTLANQILTDLGTNITDLDPNTQDALTTYESRSTTFLEKIAANTFTMGGFLKEFVLAAYPETLLTSYGNVGYEQGTNYVPEDQYAFLHKGEAVIPAEYNLPKYGVSNTPVQSNDEIVKELRELKEELQSIKTINAYGFKKTIESSDKIADQAEEANERERIK